MVCNASCQDPLCQIFQSQHNQDWFAILNFFTNVKDGFYVDVGANHFQIISNTWFLDHCMGTTPLLLVPLICVLDTPLLVPLVWAQLYPVPALQPSIIHYRGREMRITMLGELTNDFCTDV